MLFAICPTQCDEDHRVFQVLNVRAIFQQLSLTDPNDKTTARGRRRRSRGEQSTHHH
jgi:hypothetical protein